MSNPLTEGQIIRINEISKLPTEKQSRELKEFLKTLTSEQLEFLKNQQQQGCLFCKIAKGEIKSREIYYDNDVVAILDINPANKGHILVFPKEHYEFLSDLPDNLALLSITKKLSSIVIRTMNAEGVNVLISSGAIAGQKVPHFIIHLIPRFSDDGINFSWASKKISDKEMNKIESLLKERISNYFFKKEDKKVIEKIEPEEDFEEERIP